MAMGSSFFMDFSLKTGDYVISVCHINGFGSGARGGGVGVHAHYELRGDYDSADVATIKTRIHEEVEELRADPANQVEPVRLIGETDAAAAVK